MKVSRNLLSVVLGSICFFFLNAPVSCFADQEVMKYIYHPPESKKDVRYLYHWEILETALEKTKNKWGDYHMQPSEFMTEKRQALELMNVTGKLTVMYLSPTPNFRKSLLPIRIPVDKNLSGYFVFLIRKENQSKLDSVNTLIDLHKFEYGLGHGWVDVGIMESHGFKVVTGTTYDGLFEMLYEKRFTLFPRSAVEIIDEYELRKNMMPDLHIEESIVFYYTLPMYFWFSNTTEGKRLADRAQEGMWAMIEDGTYDKLFGKHFREKIKRLRLNERKMFKIDNPNLGSETPFSDKRLWFDPRMYN